jgi:hypothetical protein
LARGGWLGAVAAGVARFCPGAVEVGGAFVRDRGALQGRARVPVRTYCSLGHDGLAAAGGHAFGVASVTQGLEPGGDLLGAPARFLSASCGEARSGGAGLRFPPHA